MTKFSLEEKKKAIDLVKAGQSLGKVARLTRISREVIMRFMRQTERHGLSSLREHRYDWSGEEKLAVLQYMEANDLSCAETSVQYGIKGSSTVWVWADRYRRYGMAGLEPKKRGRPKKWREPDDTMTPLERLEAENLYLRAENAYLKKLNALIAEKERRELSIIVAGTLGAPDSEIISSRISGSNCANSHSMMATGWFANSSATISRSRPVSIIPGLPRIAQYSSTATLWVLPFWATLFEG